MSSSRAPKFLDSKNRFGNSRAGLGLASLSFLTLFVIGACASSKIYQNEDGTMSSAFAGDSKQDALSQTFKDAEKYCEKRKLNLVVLDQKAPFEGNMSEEANSAIKSASRAAQVLGAGDASRVGYSVSSENKYNGLLKFRCK